MALFFMLIGGLWTMVVGMPAPSLIRLQSEQRISPDLTMKDFSNSVYMLRWGDWAWESWPEALFTPDDFTGSQIQMEPVTLTNDDYMVVQYVTHRLRLKLPPGKTYGMSVPSSDYAMRLFINGEEIDSVGVPAASREEAVPRTDTRVYHFVPQSEEVTLIVQTSNFVHRDGCYPPNIAVGLSAAVNRLAQKELIQSIVALSGLMAACLYYVALFLLNRRQPNALVLAACCLLMALMNKQLVPLFFPEYNWYIAFQAEYLIHFATFGMVSLLIHLLFPGALHKPVIWGYLGLCGLYALSTFVLDTRVYSSTLIGFQAASVLMMLYVLVRLALSMRVKQSDKDANHSKRLQNLLGFVGLLVLCLLGANDMLYHQKLLSALRMLTGWPFAAPVFTTQPGMLFFTLCYAMIVSLDFAETQRQMEEARRQLREAEAQYNEMRKHIRAELEANQPPSMDDLNLSSREKEVAMLLMNGHSREAVVNLLGISRGTVNTLCSRIYKKSGVSGVSDLMHLLGVKK